MCSLSRTSLLLGLTIIITTTGCAQNRRFHPGPRSIAAIGGRVATIVSGEPGESIASSVPDYPGDRPSDSKISGRVVDEHGRAVSDARVRLAVAGAKGGRIESVNTDSSGGFTLHRLKSGSTYVLIAEAAADQPLAGRIEATAPQSGLKLRVHPKVESSGSFRTSSAGARFGTVSDASEQDEEISDSNQRDFRANREDFDPPAPEADDLGADTRRPSNPEFRDEPTDFQEGETEFSDPDWNGVEPRDAARSRRLKRPPIPASLHPDRDQSDRPVFDMEGDGENPLPPAIGSVKSEKAAAATAQPEKPGRRASLTSTDDSGRVPAALPSDDPPAPSGSLLESAPSLVQRSRPRRDPELRTASVSGMRDSGADDRGMDGRSADPFERATDLNRKPPRTIQPELPRAPVASLFEAGSSAVWAADSAATRATRSAESSRRAVVGRSVPSRSVKWGEVAENREVPLDESLVKRPAAGPAVESTNLARVADQDRPSSQPAGRGVASGVKRADAAPGVLCRYDAANRRLHDFQLPDVQGRTVSLKDFKSDLILLDFWGTWCAPCKTSIPQLVEFQNRFGKNRLQVVGIACEQVAPEKRAALVSKARTDLAINYPLLIAAKDEPSALRQALQVQFYPTMILLDREGRVLWREEGATGTTLSRLERAIQTALEDK